MSLIPRSLQAVLLGSVKQIAVISQNQSIKSSIVIMTYEKYSALLKRWLNMGVEIWDLHEFIWSCHHSPDQVPWYRYNKSFLCGLDGLAWRQYSTLQIAAKTTTSPELLATPANPNLPAVNRNTQVVVWKYMHLSFLDPSAQEETGPIPDSIRPIALVSTLVRMGSWKMIFPWQF